MYDIQNAIADICCLTPICFMILANKSLRQNIALTLGLNKSDTIVVSSVQTLNSVAVVKSSSTRTNIAGTHIK
uniref:Uncharacterized protein n=1 Tax=Panagrolaimus davidi TaxID=227884 RepID=A0A914PCE9_9BILA